MSKPCICADPEKCVEPLPGCRLLGSPATDLASHPFQGVTTPAHTDRPIPEGWTYEPTLLGSEPCPNEACDYMAMVRANHKGPGVIVCAKCGYTNKYLAPAPVLKALDLLAAPTPTEAEPRGPVAMLVHNKGERRAHEREWWFSHGDDWEDHAAVIRSLPAGDFALYVATTPPESPDRERERLVESWRYLAVKLRREGDHSRASTYEVVANEVAALRSAPGEVDIERADSTDGVGKCDTCGSVLFGPAGAGTHCVEAPCPGFVGFTSVEELLSAPGEGEPVKWMILYRYPGLIDEWMDGQSSTDRADIQAGVDRLSELRDTEAILAGVYATPRPAVVESEPEPAERADSASEPKDREDASGQARGSYPAPGGGEE